MTAVDVRNNKLNACSLLPTDTYSINVWSNGLSKQKELKEIVAQIKSFYDKASKLYVQLVQLVNVTVTYNFSTMLPLIPYLNNVSQTPATQSTALQQPMSCAILMSVKENRHFEQLLNTFLLIAIMQTEEILKIVEEVVESNSTGNESSVNKLRHVKSIGKEYLQILKTYFDYWRNNNLYLEKLSNTQIDRLVSCKKRLLKALKNLNPGLFPAQRSIDSNNMMEIILNLQNYANFLNQLSPECRLSQSNEYWALAFVENQYSEAKLSDFDFDTDKKTVLQKLGLNKAAAEYLASELTTGSEIWSTQEPIYWVKSYVRNAFTSDILLNNIYTYVIFPFQSDITLRWIEGSSESLNNYKFVNIYSQGPIKNLSVPSENDEFSTSSMTDWVKQLNTSDSSEYKLLFHAGGTKSSIKLCEDGIDLSYGAEKQDFSSNSGFYLSDKIEVAVDRCFTGRLGGQSLKAIFIYRVEKSELTNPKYKHMDLTTNKDDWTACIVAHRTHKTKNMKDYKNCGFITGPMSKGPICDEKYVEGFSRDSWQMCVRSTEFGDYLNRCLFRVIFIYRNK